MNGIAKDALKGAVAGAVATWAMDKATTAMVAREDEAAKAREEEARGGRTAYESAAEKVAGAAGRELSDDERKRVGTAMHWGLGIGAGAVYGVLRRRLPHAHDGHGLAFGTAFFLAVDEAANAALGFTPPPGEFPWQTHARGLAGHAVFGVVADTTLHALDRVI